MFFEERQNPSDLNTEFGLKKKRVTKKLTTLEITPKFTTLEVIPTEQDYTYDFLKSRLYEKLMSENKDFLDLSLSLHIQPPRVERSGTKTTIWSNFYSATKATKRDPQHMADFFKKECNIKKLSIDGQKRLVMSGRFYDKNIERVLKTYVKNYVQCVSCKKFDTDIIKERGLCFLKCRICSGKNCIKDIKKL
jgi:translation initiation factor 2 subunit 2